MDGDVVIKQRQAREGANLQIIKNGQPLIETAVILGVAGVAIVSML